MRCLGLPRCALTLLLALSLFFTIGCNTSKLDRIITALDLAATLPAALNLPAAETQRLTTGFGALSAALRQFKDNPTGPVWQNVLAVFDDLNRQHVWHVGDPAKQARIDAIVTVLRRMIDSLSGPQPHTMTAVVGARASPGVVRAPLPKEINERDVKALEQAVRH